VPTHPNQPQSDDIVTRCRAAVRVEMRANDRQLLANFRNAFLQWVNDDASSEFLRAAGAPDTVALEEVAAGSSDHAAKTLRVEVIWDLNRGVDRSSAQITEPGAMPSFSLSSPASPVGPGDAGSIAPGNANSQFVFFPDPPAADPIYRDVNGPLRVSADQRTTRAQLVRSLAPLTVEELALGWRGIHARTLAAYRTARRRSLRVLADPRMRGALVFGATAAILLMATIVYLTLRPRSEADRIATRTPASPPVSQLETNRRAQMGGDQLLSSATSRDIPDPNRDLLKRKAPSRPSSGNSVPTTGRTARRQTAANVRAKPAARAVPPPGRRQVPASAVSSSAARRDSDSATVQPAIATSPVVASRSAPFVVGTLVVTSEPAGAEVLINGVSHGRTPLRIPGLAAGSRVVRLELPGYERWSWAVRVVANRQTPLVVKLQPEGRKTN
jgi:hypothetical protein